jgi:hypothetical protein
MREDSTSGSLERLGAVSSFAPRLLLSRTAAVCVEAVATDAPALRAGGSSVSEQSARGSHPSSVARTQ